MDSRIKGITMELFNAGLINGNFIITKELKGDYNIKWAIVENTNESPRVGDILRRAQYEDSTELWNKPGHRLAAVIEIMQQKISSNNGSKFLSQHIVSRPAELDGPLAKKLTELLRANFPRVSMRA